MRKLRRLAWALLVLTLGGLAACSANATVDESAEPAIGAIPASVDVRTLALPLDIYVFNARQHRQRDRAISILAMECLHRFGYKVQMPSIPDAAREGHEGTFGITDEQDARRFGYHLRPVDHAAKPKEPAMPAGAFAVMHGEVKASQGQEVPEGGCLGEARRRIGEVDQSMIARAVSLVNRASTDTKRDSRVVAAFARWSACMKDRGFTYADPWAANDDPRWQGARVADAAEIQVAVADVTCKKETNLVSVWTTVEAAYQRRALEANSAVLTELKTAMDAEMNRVAAVLVGAK